MYRQFLRSQRKGCNLWLLRNSVYFIHEDVSIRRCKFCANSYSRFLSFDLAVELKKKKKHITHINIIYLQINENFKRLMSKKNSCLHELFGHFLRIETNYVRAAGPIPGANLLLTTFTSYIYLHIWKYMEHMKSELVVAKTEININNQLIEEYPAEVRRKRDELERRNQKYRRKLQQRRLIKWQKFKKKSQESDRSKSQNTRIPQTAG